MGEATNGRAHARQSRTFREIGTCRAIRACCVESPESRLDSSSGCDTVSEANVGMTADAAGRTAWQDRLRHDTAPEPL